MNDKGVCIILAAEVRRVHAAAHPAGVLGEAIGKVEDDVCEACGEDFAARD